MRNIMIIAIGLLTLSMTTSCMIIRQGDVGVKRKLGRIQPQTLMEGPKVFNPFLSTIITVPIRTVNLEVRLPLPSKEGLTINSEISILYHVKSEAAPILLQEVGKRYEREMILPVFRSAAADVTARFMAKDMHSGARAVIENEIKERMNEILNARGLTIDNVLMKSISLPPGLASAIEDKLEAEQEAQRMQFVKQRERADAERRIIQAEGERDATILQAEAQKRTVEIEAEGEAKAILTKATAQAQANELLSKSIDEEILRYRAIEAFMLMSNSPGSRVIITNGDTPFLGLPEAMLNK